MSRKKTAENYHDLAKSKNLEWLGLEVVNVLSKTTWGCQHGHSWESSFHCIQKVIGCPRCAKIRQGNRQRGTPEKYHDLARNNGFEWLGLEVPKNRAIKTNWRCQEGHEWETTYASIGNGGGCPVCAKTKPKRPPTDYYDLAKKRGFNWLGPETPDTQTKTTWQCPSGHNWKAPYHSIKHGSGCPECAKRSKASKRRVPPENYHSLAQKNGFEWLGPNVPNIRTKTKWRCQQFHEWEARYNDVQQGHGCPICSGNVKLTPQDYHDLAKMRGFGWLGPEVFSNNTKTKWQCQRGHQWVATYGNIYAGTGCPTCNESKGERKIAEILKSLQIPFTRQKRFDKCKDKRHLPFDFYFQIEDKYFLIEYQGEQHYRAADVFGGEKFFERRQQHDQIKADFAKEYGFILIIIPYTEYKNIHPILWQAIEAHTGKSINDLIKADEGNRKTRNRKFEPVLYTQATF